MKWFMIQKSAVTRLFPASVLIVALAVPATAGNNFDGYYNYLEDFDYPKEVDTVYAQDVQGIAHDDQYWYITQQGADGVHLYKIHVSENLADPTIALQTDPTLSGLLALGYENYKAMDSWINPVDGQWYVFIAVTGPAGVGIAAYNELLHLRGVAPLEPTQASLGWCAIDKDGRIYSGENLTNTLNRWDIDWNALAAPSSLLLLTLDPQQISLVHPNGLPLIMEHYQGGAFTPEGDKLFITTGFPEIANGPHGIHVFEVTGSTWKRVQKSGQSGLFSYLFDPQLLISEEPEDLTFWDLTGGQNPNITGQLHVLLLDNELLIGDEVYLKHYIREIHVDGSSVAAPWGDPGHPDVTVTDAVNRALGDMRIFVYSGVYQESLTIDKKLMLLNPLPGNAVIGQ